jgi:hypothetical protein
MARIIEVIPVELLDPDAKEKVIALIRDLPAHPEDKKQLYLEWCRMVGAVLTKDDVDKVLGR